MQRLKLHYGLPSGVVLLLVGFGYELYFNNIPYPDPTPEMAARWELNETVANGLYLAGLLLILASLALIAIRKVRGGTP
jgi:hypothetical protein